jgi:2,3-bisphosphoglycerate-dependent phosphoglycerate mutase
MGVDMGILPSKEDQTNLPSIDVVFCSLLKRSCDTMSILLDEIGLAEKVAVTVTSSSSDENGNVEVMRPRYQYPVPIIQSWRLNERHYGALVGMSKEGAERLYGKMRLSEWKETWSGPPPPMTLAMLERWKIEDHCQPMSIIRELGEDGLTGIFDPAVLSIQIDNDDGVRIVEHGRKRTNNDTHTIENETFMPLSESLHDTYERFLPLWIQGIAPYLRSGRTVCVVAHANTIRSILFAIDSEVATKQTAKMIKIPSALPLVYEFVEGDSVTPTSTHNGREYSEIIPGNLRLLKPNKKLRRTKTVKRNADEYLRHQLNGTWVETDETKSVSFCVSVRPTFERDEDYA